MISMWVIAWSFAKGVRTATGGRGVDSIINSLVGDLMHTSWDCLANFGRFVEIGKCELVDADKLQMSIFLKNTTFTAFDLSELFFREDQYCRDIWIAKTKEALALYRAGKASLGPSLRMISQRFPRPSVRFLPRTELARCAHISLYTIRFFIAKSSTSP
ncbi:hypothetical protein F4815DRAFT_223543 [Daldinia loculata]|nr:hypothetical protein F4815DRAFT_223543 [Daldinia loculata]